MGKLAIMPTKKLATKIDLSAARKKIAHAELLLGYLQRLPGQIAVDNRRAVGATDHQRALEAFFGACLGAAQSCFYILAPKKPSPAVKAIASRWRESLDEATRARFNAMTHLRDDDVHFGAAASETLETMIEIDDDGSRWGQRGSSIVLGLTLQPMSEHLNPDGKEVRSRHGLQSTFGLYVDLCGSKTDAAVACAEYIRQLHSLISAAERPILSKQDSPSKGNADE